MPSGVNDKTSIIESKTEHDEFHEHFSNYQTNHWPKRDKNANATVCGESYDVFVANVSSKRSLPFGITPQTTYAQLLIRASESFGFPLGLRDNHLVYNGRKLPVSDSAIPPDSIAPFSTIELHQRGLLGGSALSGLIKTTNAIGGRVGDESKVPVLS